MKNLCPALLLIFCFLQTLYVALSLKSYPITTLINSKWTFTPVHLEVAEFIADESPALYWDYLNSLNGLQIEISNLGENLQCLNYDQEKTYFRKLLI